MKTYPTVTARRNLQAANTRRLNRQTEVDRLVAAGKRGTARYYRAVAKRDAADASVARMRDRLAEVLA